MGKLKEVLKFGIIENGANEQDCVCTPCACLEYLVLVEDKIFAQHRNIHVLLNGRKITRRAEKKVRLGQYRDSRCLVSFIGAGQLYGFHRRRKQALRRGSSFHLNKQKYA